MPLEIEVKLRVESLGAVRKRLRAAGARRLGKVREENIFFDRPDGSLRKADSGLRVRTETMAGGREKPTALLTFKGPPRKSRLAPREAFDLTVVPREQLMPLLAALGFVRTLSYEKMRESWELGGCRVELDEVPYLGTFLEIEGPSTRQVLAVQRRLGLEKLPPVKPSYIAMMDAYVREHGIRGRAIKVARGR